MWAKDFSEFVGLLNEHEVEYLIVGGYALAIHGHPRFTGDLDVWVKPTSDNAVKISAVMDDFGFGSLGLSPDDFMKIGNVIQLGYPPLRIDVLTSADGVSFEECYPNRFIFEYGNEQVPVIGLQDLKRNKHATGRTKDLFDLEMLKEENDRD